MAERRRRLAQVCRLGFGCSGEVSELLNDLTLVPIAHRRVTVAARQGRNVAGITWTIKETIRVIIVGCGGSVYSRSPEDAPKRIDVDVAKWPWIPSELVELNVNGVAKPLSETTRCSSVATMPRSPCTTRPHAGWSTRGSTTTG